MTVYQWIASPSFSAVSCKTYKRQTAMSYCPLHLSSSIIDECIERNLEFEKKRSKEENRKEINEKNKKFYAFKTNQIRLEEYGKPF